MLPFRSETSLLARHALSRIGFVCLLLAPLWLAILWAIQLP